MTERPHGLSPPLLQSTRPHRCHGEALGESDYDDTNNNTRIPCSQGLSRDAQLETQIADAQADLLAATSREARQAAWQRFRRAILRRSPERVRAIELERGLAGRDKGIACGGQR